MILGERREQYQNLKRLCIAPKTHETYEQIIVAYIKGASEFFADLNELCLSLERREAHLDSKEYAGYEYINSIRHANPLNRYDEYVNELGWSLKKLGGTAFGIPESSFDVLKQKVLNAIVRKINPNTLTEAMKRMRINLTPAEGTEQATERENTDIMYQMFYANPSEETLKFMLGVYDGYVLHANDCELQLQNMDISGLDFNDPRIDAIIETAIEAAKARTKARDVKDLLRHKYGEWVADMNINRIERQNQTRSESMLKKIS